MKTKLVVLASAFCLLNAPDTLAQKTIYTLEEAWQQSLQHYPSLTAGKALVEQSELQKALVKKQSLPDINFQAQQSYGSYQSVAGSFFPLPGLYNSSGSNKNGTAASYGANLYASAVLQWNFMQFGRVKKNVAVADAGIEMSKAALSQEAFQLQAAVTRHYFAALQSTALVNLYRADAQRLSDLLNLVKSQSGAGLLPGADTLLIKSAVQLANTRINEQQASLKTALLQLAAFTGANANTIAVDTALFFRLPLTDILGTTDAQNHPYLQYLQSSIHHSRAELEAVKSEAYPSIGLLAGTGVRGSGIDAAGRVNTSVAAPWQNGAGSYLVGVGITWKLSSLYEQKTRQRIADRSVAAATSNLDEAQLQLNTLYAAAQESWIEQRQKLKEAKGAFEFAQQAYDLYTVRYESGLISLIELLQLQKSLQDAETSYVMAIHSYWTEILNQAEALGNMSLLRTALQP